MAHANVTVATLTQAVKCECHRRYSLGGYPQRMGNLSIDSGVVELIRKWVFEQTRANVTLTKMAKQLGVSRTTVINIRDRSKGAGPTVEAAFAKLEYGGSVDALRRAARGEAPVGRVVEIDDRYDSRRRACRAAAELGYGSEAIEKVQILRLEDDEDPGPEFWLDMIRIEDRRIKKGIK